MPLLEVNLIGLKMLHIKTYLAKSTIHGIGLFTDENVKEGQLIWKFTLGVDQIFYKSLLEDTLYNKIKDYCYVDGSFVILCADNARFMNHFINPNTNEKDDGSTYANKDIDRDIELTCDYYSFDLDAERKLTPSKIQP